LTEEQTTFLFNCEPSSLMSITSWLSMRANPLTKCLNQKGSVFFRVCWYPFALSTTQRSLVSLSPGTSAVTNCFNIDLKTRRFGVCRWKKKGTQSGAAFHTTATKRQARQRPNPGSLGKVHGGGPPTPSRYTYTYISEIYPHPPGGKAIESIWMGCWAGRGETGTTLLSNE